MTGFIIQQDTISPKIVVRIRTDKLLSDSVFRKFDEKPAHIKEAEARRLARQVIPAEAMPVDTVSVCPRNTIADVTFYDSLNFVRDIKIYPEGTIPFRITQKSGTQPELFRTAVISDLKNGKPLPLKTIHPDWLIGLIFVVVWFFVIVRRATRNMRPEISRFFLLRGVNEPVSRDVGSLFYWQSTITNFISFLTISIFGYCVAAYYEIIPPGIPAALSVAAIFGIVAVCITLRHFVCFITGRLSGETEAFNEYILNIYQSYRFFSFLIFIIILLLVYTVFCPPEICFMAGIAFAAVFYIYRILRLILIFIKRDISIFYLILYFCALEILPALILAKYLSSLK